MDAARIVPLLERICLSDVEHVRGPRGVGEERGERAGVDDGDPVTLAHRISQCARGGPPPVARLGDHLRRAGHRPESRELPPHRAVLQCEHGVRYPRVAETLRADDRPRPPRAVHHHRRVGRREKTRHPVHQLGTGTVDTARQADGAELRHRARVDEHHLPAGRQPLPQLRRLDPRRVEIVLDHLAERLRDDPAAGEDLAARRLPRILASPQHPQVGVAVCLQDPRRPGRQHAGVVNQHRAGGAPRDHHGGEHLDLGERDAGGGEDVGARERTAVAHVGDHDLAAVVQPLPEGVGFDGPHGQLRSPASFMSGSTFSPKYSRSGR